MKNPKSFLTFLEGFNLGTFLSLISLLGILMTSRSIQLYSFIIILILTNGMVVGVVRQYVLIQLTLTSNMGVAFKQSKNQIPNRLLEIRNHKKSDALTLLVGISTRLRLNMCMLALLMTLLILSLMLPVIYSYRLGSNMMILSIVWSALFLIYMCKIIKKISKNCTYIQKQITYLLEINQFNRTEFRHKES